MHVYIYFPLLPVESQLVCTASQRLMAKRMSFKAATNKTVTVDICDNDIEDSYFLFK